MSAIPLILRGRCTLLVTMKHLRVTNLTSYQHYSKRNPPWVKLHRTSLNDYDLRNMPPISRLCFHYCTILASETDNFIPYDLKYLSERMGFDVTELVLSPLLLKKCLLASGERRIHSSVALSSVSVSASESSSESDGEKSAEKRGNEEFESFWAAYPKKVGKKAARDAWKHAKDKPVLVDILQAIDKSKKSDTWRNENGKFIPHPATWLNQGRWDDVIPARPMTTMEAFLARGEQDDTRGIRQGVVTLDHTTVGQGVPDTGTGPGRH